MLYVDRYQRGALSGGDVERLRVIAVDDVRRDMLRTYSRITDVGNPACRVTGLWPSPLGSRDLALVDVRMACGKELGVGFVFARVEGRWMVVETRDRRFDASGKCRAVSCRRSDG